MFSSNVIIGILFVSVLPILLLYIRFVLDILLMLFKIQLALTIFVSSHMVLFLNSLIRISFQIPGIETTFNNTIYYTFIYNFTTSNLGSFTHFAPGPQYIKKPLLGMMFSMCGIKK
jgi:hypothetical protein